jgi:hypothetical protein
MIFDTEKQKQIILELLDSVTIPGKALDELYQFKHDVLAGEIKPKDEEEKK